MIHVYRVEEKILTFKGNKVYKCDHLFVTNLVLVAIMSIFTIMLVRTCNKRKSPLLNY